MDEHIYQERFERLLPIEQCDDRVGEYYFEKAPDSGKLLSFVKTLPLHDVEIESEFLSSKIL